MSQGENPSTIKPQSTKSRAWIWIVVVVVIIVIIAGVSAGLYEKSKISSKAPKEIVIGTLYASTGSYSATSMPEYDGLLLWANEVNAQGGIMVSSLGEKLKVEIVAYDDSSDTSTATNLYNQLITVNHVNFMVADFGSVLTAPAVTIAEEHHVLLFDVTGSSATFFNTTSPYIVLTSIPGTPAYATYGAAQLLSLNISKVAVVYAENDFTQPLAQTFVSQLANKNITPVYYQGFDTSQSDFSSMITTLQSYKPQAVVFYGYPTNDIPFINGLHSAGVSFPYLFTIFPGQLYDIMSSAVGTNMSYTFTYSFPPEQVYNNVDYGMNLSALESTWNSSYSSIPFGYLSIAGYTAGLVIQDGITTAGSLNATAVRDAINTFSGKITTVDGLFQVNPSTGMQTGEAPPVGQVVPNGSGGLKVVIVYPASMATGSAVYPNPNS